MESELPEWARSALITPSTSRYIDVDGCLIHYLSWGAPTRPPVLLVHGNAAHAEWWRFIAPSLATEYYVLAPDLGGMGDSSHCGRYERERYADQIMAVAAAAAPGKAPFIVGHSLGGFIAIMAGSAYGSYLKGVIAIDSPIEPPDQVTQPPAVQTSTLNASYSTQAEALQRFRLVPAQPVGHQFYLDHIARHSLIKKDDGWRWKFDPAATAHPRPSCFSQQLLDMRCPAALFLGEQSQRINDQVRAYMRCTFGQKISVIGLVNCRHHVMLDEPLALISALRTQLSAWTLSRNAQKVPHV